MAPGSRRSAIFFHWNWFQIKSTSTRHIHKHAVSARIQKTHQGKKYKFSRLRLTLKLKVDQKRILTKIGLSIYFSNGATFRERVSLISILATAIKTKMRSLTSQKFSTSHRINFCSLLRVLAISSRSANPLVDQLLPYILHIPDPSRKLFSRRKKNISCMLTRVDGSPTSRETRLIKQIMLINIASQKIGIVFRKKKTLSDSLQTKTF